MLADQPLITIEGDRVALGPLRRDLLDTYTRWINNIATQRMVGGLVRGWTLEQETAWVDGVTASGEVAFTIYEKATWRPIGNTGLHDIDLNHRIATFGILIGEEDARGKGFGTETTVLMLDYAFTARNLHNVMLTVFEFNPAARRAYEKAGFREIGRRREARMMGGKMYDTVYMDCLASEFTSPVLAHILKPEQPRS
jgi:diamine N-acetyltransferase